MVSLTLKVVLQGAENDSEYRDVAPLRWLVIVYTFPSFTFYYSRANDDNKLNLHVL